MAGADPRAPGAGDRGIPDLLRTHPVNTDRISDAKARADALTEQQKAARARGNSLPPIPAGYRLTPPREDDLSPLPRLDTTVVKADGPNLYFALMRERARVRAPVMQRARARGRSRARPSRDKAKIFVGKTYFWTAREACEKRAVVSGFKPAYLGRWKRKPCV